MSVTPETELEAFKDWHFQGITMYKTFVLSSHEKTGTHTENGEFGI